MTGERSFVYGFRIAHCAQAIAMFFVVVALGAWKAATASNSFARLVGFALAVGFAYLAIAMAGWLVMRRRGSRRIVVGTTAITAPPVTRWRVPDVSILFADVTGVQVSSAGKGALRIQHPRGTLEIGRQMLGSDGEFEELVKLVRDRVPT